MTIILTQGDFVGGTDFENTTADLLTKVKFSILQCVQSADLVILVERIEGEFKITILKNRNGFAYKTFKISIKKSLSECLSELGFII